MENVMEVKEVKVETNLDGVGKALGEVLTDAVKQATNAAMGKIMQPIQIVMPENKVGEIKGAYHYIAPTLLRVIGARLPAFLVGEAGSGKTHLVEQCAESLGLKFYCISVCAQTTASTLLGYMDANGKYVRSLFREAYENGGVFLLDEVDNGNPNVLSVLNASISNHVCSFPDKMVAKHPDFVLCASGNTYGHGANRKYVGRLEIDAATLDRFVFIDIGYDEKLEEQICGNPDYAKLIQWLRKRANEMKLRNIISPRASINGVKLLNSGLDLMKVLDYTVFRDMPEDTKKQLLMGDFNKLAKNLGANIEESKEETKKPAKRGRKKIELEPNEEKLMKEATKILGEGGWYLDDGEKPMPDLGNPLGGIKEVKF